MPDPTHPRRARLVILLVVTTLGLACVGVFGYVLRESFAKLHFARVFPLGYAPQSESEVAGPVELAIYGDSRAYLWDRSSLRLRGKVSNLAHGGITSTQLLLQLKGMPPVRSSSTLVQVGINDLHPLGVLGKHRDAILVGLERNLVEIVGLLGQRSERVVVTTIVPPGPVPLVRLAVWDSATPEHIARVNDAIRKLPESFHSVVVLDAAALLAGEADYLPEKFVGEDFFLHLNVAAYAVLNDELAKILGRSSDQR